MYSLSGAQSRNNAAVALSISENTIKTHLTRIFAKTKTRNKTELVGLMRSIASP